MDDAVVFLFLVVKPDQQIAVAWIPIEHLRQTFAQRVINYPAGEVQDAMFATECGGEGNTKFMEIQPRRYCRHRDASRLS
jgi:hypothetical protein